MTDQFTFGPFGRMMLHMMDAVLPGAGFDEQLAGRTLGGAVQATGDLYATPHFRVRFFHGLTHQGLGRLGVMGRYVTDPAMRGRVFRFGPFVVDAVDTMRRRGVMCRLWGCRRQRLARFRVVMPAVDGDGAVFAHFFWFRYRDYILTPLVIRGKWIHTIKHR